MIHSMIYQITKQTDVEVDKSKQNRVRGNYKTGI